jgi:MFS family permease
VERVVPADRRVGLGWRQLTVLVFGTPLNPLNSSMIAVALVRLHADFSVSLGVASWLVSGFYLSAAVAQPLEGRLADRFGPRRVYCGGLVIVLLTGAAAPFVPGFGWLVLVRVLQALGSSAAYPSALALIRAGSRDPRGRPPAGTLAVLSIANTLSSAVGPVVGGVLVTLAGWQAIFLVNVPIAGAGLLLALRWLPHDPRPARPAGGWRQTVALVDPAGVVLFAVAVTGLLGFLLSLGSRPAWPLLAVPPLAGGLLVWQERRVATPFLDVRMLAANRPLLGVLGQFVLVNAVFYMVFFGLPLWLEQARGLQPGTAGLVLFPVAAAGMALTPLAATAINRAGVRAALVPGSAALLAGSLLLLALNTSTPLWVLLVVGVVLGIPNGFNNLGMQAALYTAAPPDQTGAAGGLLQTARYTGAILSTSVIGIVYGATADTSGLHVLALVMAALSLVLLWASLARPQRPAPSPSSG